MNTEQNGECAEKTAAPHRPLTSEELIARIRRFNAELDRLTQRLVLDQAPFEAFTQEVTHAVAEALQVARVSVWRFDEAHSAIICADLFHLRNRDRDCGARLERKDFPNYFDAVLSVRVIDASDARSDPHTAEFRDSYLVPNDILSMLDAQIRSATGIRGVLCCETVGEARDWTPDEAAFVSSAADLLGLAFAQMEQVRVMADLERRNAEFREQTQEIEKLAMVARHINDAVVISNGAGEVEWVNASYATLTGYSLDEVKGRKPGRILRGPDTDRETAARISHALEHKKPVRAEILNYAKSGREYWTELQINPVFGADGDFHRFIAVQRDITDRIAQKRRISEALEEARDASAAKTAFLANMSHEIRTPMNGVLGMAEVLARTDLNEHQQKILNVIRESGDVLMTVLNDVLDVSRIEAGQMAIERIPFQLDELLDRIEAAYGTKCAEKGVELRIEGRAQFGEPVVGDPTRIAQVLHNLVSNAVKFTPGGVITVSVRLEDTAKNSDRVSFEVCDTGIGMTDKEQSRIFERFRQADQSTTRNFGGAGLGLSIVHGLTNAMGGDIRVESTPGEGSVFIVRLPLKPASKAADVADADTAMEAGSPAAENANSISILVAEDNPSNRTVVKMLLETLECDLAFAENGRQAVDMIEERAFDLILMDIQMPVMDGEEALGEIRRMEREGARPPSLIAALTANAMDHHVKRYREIGFDDFIAKPICMNDLQGVVSRAAAAKLARAAAPGPSPSSDFTDETPADLHARRATAG